MIPIKQYKTDWRRVPGMDIWQNADGRRIIIEGMEDKGYAVAVMYRDILNKSKTRVNLIKLGKPVRTVISPYYVFSQGIGQEGRAYNAQLRAMRNWQSGTREDAISAAYRYMNGGKK